MKKLLLATVAGVMLATVANAADLDVLPTKIQGTSYTPSPMLPGFTWAGSYVGGHVGYGWGSFKPDAINLYNNPASSPDRTIPGLRADSNGWVLGVQGGYNWQFGQWVLGLEADWSSSSIKGAVADTTYNYISHGEIDWFTTARVRVGFAVVPNVLVFGTGGLSYGRVKATLNDIYPAKIVTTTQAQMHFGWSAGGGAEWAFTRNLTFRIEYLHIDLGSKTYSFSEPNPAPNWPLITVSSKATADIVRAAANVKW